MTDRTRQPPTAPLTDVRLDFPACQTLTCGMPLWVIDGGDQQVCQLSVYVEGGTMHQQHSLQAALTAQMCLEGSAAYSTRDIAEMLDYHGAGKMSQCHDTMSQITLSTITEHYHKLLPVVCDSLARALLPEQELEVYKRQYASSYATMRGRVAHRARVELRRLRYGDGHPLVEDVTPDDIMSLTPDDISRFYRRFYHPSNCRLVLAGRVNDQMISATDRAFSQWLDPDDQRAPQLSWQTNPSPQMLSVVDCPGAVQAAIAMAIDTIGRSHPDYLALRMLCTVLGGYSGSRLMTVVREQMGYTYGINAYLAGREHDGYVGVSTECDQRHVSQVIDLVKHEMQQLCDQLISDHELSQVRQFMLSDQAKTLDTPFSLASYVASTWLYGVYPDYYNQQINTILHTTAVRLREVAQRYFDLDRLRIVIAGDR